MEWRCAIEVHSLVSKAVCVSSCAWRYYKPIFNQLGPAHFISRDLDGTSRGYLRRSYGGKRCGLVAGWQSQVLTHNRLPHPWNQEIFSYPLITGESPLWMVLSIESIPWEMDRNAGSLFLQAWRNGTPTQLVVQPFGAVMCFVPFHRNEASGPW